MKLIKKGVMLLSIIIILVLMVGCLNYKSYEGADTKKPAQDTSVIDEIAQIEKELGLAENKTKTTTKVVNKTNTTKKVTISMKDTKDTSGLQKITVKENQLVDLSVKIEDPDKDNVNYSFTMPLNEVGKWKTNYGDAGEYVVTISATDGKLTTKKDILLKVTRVNVPPLIKTVKNQTVKEGETVKLTPQVIDPNGDAVNVKISTPLTTGTWVTDHKSAGEYSITITASDGEKESKELFLLTVLDVNVLPKITGLQDNVTLNEGGKLEIKQIVNDLDNDVVNVTIMVTKLGSSEAIKTCKKTCIWKTGYTDHGNYIVSVVADDGKDKVTKAISLVINDINMPPQILEVKLS